MDSPTPNQRLRDELALLQPEMLRHPERLGEELRDWVATAEGGAVVAELLEEYEQHLHVLNMVAIPSGSAERCRAAVLRGISEAESGGASEVELGEDLSQPFVTPREHDGLSRGARSAGRWRPLVAMLGGSMALLLLVGVVMAVVFWPSGPELSSDALAHQSLRWASGAVEADWQAVDSEVLKRAPLPDDLVVEPQRWSRFETEWGDRGILYDLAGPETPTAFLFVIETPMGATLPERLGARPDYETGTYCVASVRQRDRLYVLLVEGSVARYRSFLVPTWPFG